MKKAYSLMVFLVFMTFIFSSCSSSSSSPAPGPLIVFGTSATGDGNLDDWTDAINAGQSAGGLAAGDAICQAAATKAGLPGIYKAWLSSSTTDAYCHIQGYDGHTISDNCGQGVTLPTAAGPWVRTHDGYPFADTIDKLVTYGQVFTPIIYDESGNLLPSGSYSNTGTNPDGTRYPPSGPYSYNCKDWTYNVNDDYVISGYVDGTTGWWTNLGASDCSENDRNLLCFQTGTGGSLPSLTPPASSKQVFVTSVIGDGNLGGGVAWTAYAGGKTGIAAGDKICQTLASNAGLINAAKFKAWLSDSTPTNAIDRLTSNGPWYRLDGVKVAGSKADLTTAPLFTAITYTETGVYYDYFAV